VLVAPLARQRCSITKTGKWLKLLTLPLPISKCLQVSTMFASLTAGLIKKIKRLNKCRKKQTMHQIMLRDLKFLYYWWSCLTCSVTLCLLALHKTLILLSFCVFIASIARCELNSNMCIRRWINIYYQYQPEVDSKFRHRMDNRREVREIAF
jgi:hypothetical protein